MKSANTETKSINFDLLNSENNNDNSFPKLFKKTIYYFHYDAVYNYLISKSNLRQTESRHLICVSGNKEVKQLENIDAL